MDNSERIRKNLIEEIRLNKIAKVRLCVRQLLLARYGVLLKAQAYQMGRRDGSTAYEAFHVFPSYEAGDIQPLVEYLRLHKDHGLSASPGLWDFIIDAVQGKKSHTPGPKKSRALEQRDLKIAIAMASYMYLDDLEYDPARAKVVEDTGCSESMVGRAYNRFAMFFSQKTTLSLQPPR